MLPPRKIEQAYALAREQYDALGVDTEDALDRLARIPLSLQCWQGDDVTGFEPEETGRAMAMQVTGNHPGRARNADELREDLDLAFRLLPGTHRLNLHAIYAETGGRRVERNRLEPAHFARWIDWAKAAGRGLDFNPTFFAHPRAADGFTLSHPDAGVRRFWIEHGIACRHIAAAMGKALGTPCVHNVWVPDGTKDTPADRRGPRERLRKSLDALFKEKLPARHLLDAVEAKLFGIGTETFVVGSHEFYLGYAVEKQILLCLDSGHFHPTETISDKISAVLLALREILLHVSRGVRWDSDHVVTLGDDLRAIAAEVVRNGAEKRIHLALDYFDASINRIAAWVIGARNLLKALLIALLEPDPILRTMESQSDRTGRLALQEEAKMLPAGAVWDYYCLKNEVPVAMDWLEEVRNHEAAVLPRRG